MPPSAIARLRAQTLLAPFTAPVTRAIMEMAFPASITTSVLVKEAEITVVTTPTAPTPLVRSTAHASLAFMETESIAPVTPHPLSLFWKERVSFSNFIW